MANLTLLEEKISESGLKKSYIAKSIGLSYQCFYNRLTGFTEFTANEIKDLCKILGIKGAKEKDQIFFR